MINSVSTKQSLAEIVKELDESSPSKLNFLVSRRGLRSIARLAAFTGITLVPGLVKRFITHTLAPQPSLALDVFSIIKCSVNSFGGGCGAVGATIVVVSEAFLFNELIVASTQKEYALWRLEVSPILEKNLMISKSYHEDHIISEHRCPITLQPIRIPVKDKNDPKHVYERAAIRSWIYLNHTSPFTKKPLSENDLILDEDTFQIIRNRIRQLDAKIKKKQIPQFESFFPIESDIQIEMRPIPKSKRLSTFIQEVNDETKLSYDISFSQISRK